MTHMQRYLFDLCFDPAEPDGGGAPGGSDEPQDGQTSAVDAPPEPPPPVFTAEELDAARAEALAEGRRLGETAATASVGGRIERLLSQVADRFGQLVAAQECADQQLVEQAVQLSLTFTRKLMPELSRRQGIAEIEAVARECLQGMLNRPRIVIRVAEEMLEPMGARVTALTDDLGYDGAVILRGDAALSPGDCQVDWAEGGAERISQRIWQDIESAVVRMSGGDAKRDLAVPHDAAAWTAAPADPAAAAESNPS